MKYVTLNCIGFVIIFSSCTTQRYIYAPAAPNLPYFTEKNQVTGTVLYSANGGENSGRAPGMDVNAAYSLTNHWAVTAGYFLRNESDKDHYRSIFDSSEIKYKRKLGMLGAGYFIPVNPRKTITINLYGSTIFGKFFQRESAWKDAISGNRIHNNNIFGFSFQPSVHFIPGRYVNLGVFFKNSRIHYGGTETNLTPEEYDYFGYKKIDHKTQSFFESGYNVQLGIPGVPWLKLNHSIVIVNDRLVPAATLSARSMGASIGLSIDPSAMNKKYRKK